MKTFSRITFFLVCLTFGLATASMATTYTYQPSDEDLNDLVHGQYYTWGLDWEVADDETVTGVTLIFDDIRNWDSSENDLWVTLLDDAAEGLTIGSDNNGEQVNYFTSDYSGGDAEELVQWEDISTIASDYTYTFTSDDLATLLAYSLDGSFGLGIDPDCHFYNNGVYLVIETTDNPVPEPATMMLFGIGLLGIAGVARKKTSRG